MSASRGSTVHPWYISGPMLIDRIRTLRDKDCPYLGNYKLGYDSALDDLLELVSQMLEERK